ncbi:MAG: hypothetical protein R3Y54_01930 [Eubacteriales bacterium]
MILEGINYNTKCYHEAGTNDVYFFDNQRFSEAIKKYSEVNKIKIEKVYDNLCEELGVDEGAKSALKKYALCKGTSRRRPVNIQECKKMGIYLCENEYIFLRRFRYVNHNMNISKIHIMIYDIFALYDTSNCFNKMPQNEQGEELTYYSECLDKVQKVIDCELYEESEETKSKLTNIVRDSRIFIKSYSVPGVVDSWLEINPSLRYFDPVFDIMESDYELYKNIKSNKYGKVHFRFYPSLQELQDKKVYFDNLECNNKNNNLNFSIERFYQDELITTINLLFKMI